MERILVVDDKEENLYLLRVLLEGHGYEVEQASNGSEALVKALASELNMIISDILMPVIDGFTLCRIFKADERLKHIPFIFYTATYTDPRDEKLALDIGANAFIIKPKEPDEFMRCIEEILVANKNGKFASQQKPAAGEEVVLKEYNEVLIRKLEHKMLELEQANKALEAEVAARKQAEENISTALQEKDALLKEIHHRVKNNMQVISSLISLQLNTDIKTLAPEKIIAIAQELQNRILSMALVHEMLYKSKSLSKIDFNEYIHHLVESLFMVYNIKSKHVSATIEVTDTPVSIATAIPLGLIISELVTNALKYAFPAERNGEIRITMTIDDDNTYNLTVRDNGIGFPDNFNIETVSSFGMHLTSILIKQLDGSTNIRNDNGALFTIKFKESEYDKFSLLDIK
jgi:two-component sensor histidine kinase/DNA-binding NarL/FixJ family response regulator